MSVKEPVSPAQVARAIGVSESTLKRWCDDGRMPVLKTIGGHRRLPVHGVLKFLRENDLELVDPAVLGLPRTTGRGARVLEKARKMLRTALIEGDESIAQQVVLNLYLAKVPIHQICDDVVTQVFHDIGEMWVCHDVDVYQERRGCEIALRVLLELRSLATRSNDRGPLAIGGTLEGDHYTLPTTIVEVVLREAGWRAVSLGTSLPFDTFAKSIADLRPQLFWLSVSTVGDEDVFVEGIRRLDESTREEGAKFVIGGRALSAELRARLPELAYSENFTDLFQSNRLEDNEVETAAEVPAGGKRRTRRGRRKTT